MRRAGLLFAVVALMGFAAQAQAATFTVGSTADTNVCPSPPAGSNCTLRQLINTVPAGSTIMVPANANPYSLTGGELLIQKNLIIVGDGARTTTIQHATSSASARVFDIQKNGSAVPTVAISGLTIESGNAGASDGGNVLNGANLILSEDLIAFGLSVGGAGAGIANDGGTLTLTHSLVWLNTSDADANGAGGQAGGIENFALRGTAAILTIDNSTIADNNGVQGGGVVSSCAGPCSSTATVTNSTIANNDGGSAATASGGLLATAGTISVQNSIVATNTKSTGQVQSNCQAANPGSIASLGHNLESKQDCGFTAAGDLRNTDPQFLVNDIASNGGNTDTIPLKATSPAVDAIPANAVGCSGTDQRDVARPQGAACDIGAYESTQQVEGQRFSEVLGSISNDATNISIDWGDASPIDTTGVFDPTTGEVTGTHTYAEAGLFHGLIRFHNSDGNFTAPFDVKVVDAPLSSSASPITAIAAKPFNGPLALFTDADPAGTGSDYTATINWGDGSATPGQVAAAPGGGFVVSGSHTYANVGSYTTTIAIADVDGATTTAHGTATVGALPSPVVTGPPSVKSSSAAAFAGSVNPDGSATTAHFEYGLDRRYVTPGTSGPQYDRSTPNQPVGSDFSSHAVTASVSGLVPNALYHVRLVATNAAGTTNGRDMTFTTQHGAVPGAPGLGTTFNVSATGLVLIKIHGVFLPLTELTKIPNGTIIDALKGTLTLTTALPGGTQHAVISANKKAKKKPKTKTQKGKFGGAIFKVAQARSGLATLSLVEGAFKGAPAYASCKAKRGGRATIAALSKKTLQLLHGSDNHGKFRTKGRYAAATTRGTVWTIADRCDGTLTRVTKDSVTVSDFVRHKTIILRAGHSYLAKARK